MADNADASLNAANNKMSTYIYIARDGLRTTPISEDAWLTAVGQCDELVVDDAAAQDARSASLVRLKKDLRATARLDRFGIVGARNPSAELITVLFKVASTLGANVYSDRFNQYESADEYIERRQYQRRAFDNQRAYKQPKQQFLGLALGGAVCATAVLFGFLLTGLYLLVRT